MTAPPAPPPRRPLWVRVILWGVPTRAHAWAYVWLCLLIAAAAVLYSFRDPRAWWGVILVFGTYGYLLAIRWMDRHGRWGS